MWGAPSPAGRSPGGRAVELAAREAAAGILPISMPFNSPGSPAAPKEKPDDEGFALMLQNLVRVLTGYPGLRLVPFYALQKHGESPDTVQRRWRTVLGMEEIHYLPEDIDDENKDVALGRAAHEAWHVLYSRPELLFDAPKELMESMAFQALWWSVEDPRVNVVGLRRHPGARSWIDAAYARDYEVHDLAAERKRWADDIPLHLQFNYALIYEWWSGQRDPRISDPRVNEALDKAADAIRRAYSTSSARRSFDIVKNEIWPIYKELVDEAYEDAQKKKDQQKQGQKGQKGQKGQQGQQSDQQDQESDSDSQSDSQSQSPSSSSSSSSSSSRSQPSQGQQGKQGKQKPQIDKSTEQEMQAKERQQRDKNASQMVDAPEKMSDAQREKAKKELEELRKKMGQKDQDSQDEQDQQDQDQQGQQGQQGKSRQGQPSEGQGQPGQGSQPSEAERQAEARRKAEQRERLSKADERSNELREPDQASYKSFYDSIKKLIPVARQQLLQVLKRKVRRRTISDRRSGDLDEESLFELPSGKPDPFVETMSSNKALYRVSLLIDTSGSMDAEKRRGAIQGAVLMMETLEKLPGVSYEIVCFDNTPRVLKAYNERLTPAAKVAVVKALLSGNGSTESHVAVQQAIERSRMGRGEKLIIMVNDGDPDYNFDRDQYRAMINAAKDVEIHGVGLGDGAQLVLDLFPPGRGWWLKDVAEFSRSLRSILQKKLLGGSAAR